MARAVKDHRSKKNPQSRESYLRRKKENVSDAKILAQYNWRRQQVKEKLERLTGEVVNPKYTKLLEDAKRLGIKVTVTK